MPRDCDVRSAEQALAYLVDCTLATVQDLAMKKCRRQNEYRRQVSIAQKGVIWMKAFGISDPGNRANSISGSVADWAKQYEV